MIPEQSTFPLAKLSDLATVGMGKTPSRKEPLYWSGKHPWVAISDLKGSKYISFTKEKISELGVNKSGIKIVPENTLLFSFKLSIGKVTITSAPIYTNEAIASFQIKDAQLLDLDYFYYTMREFDFRATGDKAVKGVTLNKAKLNELRIPLPPLEEQKQIAAILDAADELRQKDKALIAKYDELTQSLFLDMFGDMQYISIAKMIQDKIILSHKDGNYGGMYPRKTEFGEVGVPFLSARHIDGQGNMLLNDVPLLGYAKANKLSFGWIEKGDVLLSHNASIGKVALYQGQYDKALIGTSLTSFRVDRKRMNPYFLAHAFRANNFQAQLKQNMGQTTRNQVPITAQKKLKLPTPAIPLQNKFEQRVQVIESQKAFAQESRTQSEALFNSLLQKAFKGELTN